MLKYQISPHTIRPGIQVVEVFDSSGKFIATIVEGDDESEIRVVSKYLGLVDLDKESRNPLIPAVPIAKLMLSKEPVMGPAEMTVDDIVASLDSEEDRAYAAGKAAGVEAAVRIIGAEDPCRWSSWAAGVEALVAEIRRQAEAEQS